MTKTLTITYDKSNEDVPVMCVAESNLFSITVLKMFTGEKAEQLFKELTGQNVIIKAETEAESEKMSKHWIDDADHWICPDCGFITPNPNRYAGCKCPKCGFQDEKDKAETEAEDGNVD